MATHLRELSHWAKREIPMESLPLVTRAEYKDAYRIHLAFNDGTDAVVDFEDWLTGPVSSSRCAT